MSDGMPESPTVDPVTSIVCPSCGLSHEIIGRIGSDPIVNCPTLPEGVVFWLPGLPEAWRR